MIKKLIFVFTFFLLSFSLTAQSKKQSVYLQAQQLFQAEKYGLAQNLFQQIYTDESALEFQKEDALFHIAVCSKHLFNEDTKFWFDEFLSNYPYSEKTKAANYELALFYYRQKSYLQSITYFLKSERKNTEYNFKLAYSYFLLDSLESSKYYFSKLLNTDSKYAASSQYFYAHIAYKQKHYKTALSHFQQLKEDKNFSSIAPYYISQIYFLQNRFDDLITYAKPMLEKVISSREAELNRIIAEAYYRKEEFVKAVAYFEIFFEKSKKYSPLDKLQIGHAYHNIQDYENAIRYLEPLDFSEDSTKQFVAYYLANSYLNINEKTYAISSFKKASEYGYNPAMQEDAYFNYAKLSSELDLPFENVLDVLQKYLINFENTENKKVINNLIINAFQNTSRYEQAFEQLKEVEFPTIVQKSAMQRLSFFIGVKEFNNENYSQAISLFEFSNQHKINEEMFAMSTYWLANCYFNISDFRTSADLYNEYLLTSLSSTINFAQYNLGYAYFQQNDFKNAKKSFRKFTKLSKDSIRLNDAYLRTADCYFMLSDFRMAEKNYELAINYDLFDTDYAIYNRSVCLGLIGKSSDKVKLLKQLEKNYKWSAYYDDALLDLAVYYKNKNQTNLSISYYDTLLAFTSEIELKAKVHLSKGMIYFNANKIDNAIASFLIVINEYAKTTYFKEALSGLRAAYASVAKVDEYLNIVNSLPQVNISRSEQDSLTYNTAFMKFAEGDYQVAKTTFLQYLNNFKNGIFSVDAHYYLAESCIKVKDSTYTLNHFQKVIDLNDKYLEPSYLYLARHYFSNNDYKNSNKSYLNLEKIATNNSVKREAIIRLMLGFESEENEQSDLYASKVLSLDKIDDLLKNRASIILARSFFDNGNFQKAEKTFFTLSKNATDKVGAEATYMMAYLQFLNDSLEMSEEIIYQLANNFTADYWIANGFILLSDIYIQKGNDFQAKATLESVIENYDGEDLLIVARKKYENILESEIVDTTLIQEAETYINIFDEEIDYEVLFQEEIDTTEIPKTIENEE
ncbi:MAG: tetratricopeptide repeat protein [Flavobacteriales bacterium]|nr:tetratricopeptide repeat protein [Flavobacteriales bacterium]